MLGLEPDSSNLLFPFLLFYYLFYLAQKPFILLQPIKYYRTIGGLKDECTIIQYRKNRRT